MTFIEHLNRLSRKSKNERKNRKHRNHTKTTTINRYITIEIYHTKNPPKKLGTKSCKNGQNSIDESDAPKYECKVD